MALKICNDGGQNGLRNKRFQNQTFAIAGQAPLTEGQRELPFRFVPRCTFSPYSAGGRAAGVSVDGLPFTTRSGSPAWPPPRSGAERDAGGEGLPTRLVWSTSPGGFGQVGSLPSGYPLRAI